MRILMLSLNYAPEPTGIGLYSGQLAQDLAALGHQVEVVASQPHYPQWRVFEGFPRFGWTRSVEAGVSVNRCPVYVPSSPSGGRRIAHYLSFLASAFVPMWRVGRRMRPDLVIAVAPSLIAAPLALIAARRAAAASWLHIQDFEVEAAFATGNLDNTGVVARLAAAFERRMLGAFDKVSSISPEMCAKLREKGCEANDVVELRNWAELEGVKPQDYSAYRDQWNLKTRHVALYSGSIARKQGIGVIVEAARLMRSRKDLTFVVCGNGPTRADLERSAAGLDNIQFHDLQPMERLGELLSLASVHLLPQRADAADLVLPSKLANMLASGRPVVAGVHPGRGLAREVDGVGLICEPESAEAMAGAITRLLDDPDLYAATSRAARERAIERWSRKGIVGRFAERLEAVQRDRFLRRESA